jgi:hypothetical protein
MAVDDKVSCMTQKFQFHKALLVSKPKDATGHHACPLVRQYEQKLPPTLSTFIDKNLQ